MPTKSRRIDVRAICFRMRTAGTLLLTLAGVTGVVSAWIGHPLATAAGAFLLVSPSPAVFHDQNIAAAVQIELVGNDGWSLHSEIDRSVLADIDGPLVRRDVYIHALVGAPALPVSTWGHVLAYGLCHTGPLQHALAAPSAPAVAHVRLSFRSRASDRGHRLDVECAEPPRARLRW